MALLVIVSHSITLGGFGNERILGNQSLGDLAVDGFFGISGYLICGSALRHVKKHGRFRGLVHYFWDRVLRNMPDFWLCLIVTACVFGVIGWRADHSTLGGYWTHPDGPLHYLFGNSLLQISSYQISGTPAHIPYPLAWDGSLWTLYWESLCYIGIALLTALGLIFRRGIVLAIAVIIWLTEIVLFFHPSHVGNPQLALRFASIFLVGALLYLYRDRVPDSGRLALGLVVVAACGLAIGHPTSQVSDWLAGPSLVYPVLWLGAHLPFQRIGATNDISYGVYIYAFPVGQLFATADLQKAGYLTFMLATIVCTILLASASWRGLEKWALKARTWQPLSRSKVTLIN
jgi:peptidoglycan/LPS O-acetylase OafA/YrhL